MIEIKIGDCVDRLKDLEDNSVDAIICGIELSPEYAKICEARIRHWMPLGSKVVSETEGVEREIREGEQFPLFDF